MVHIRSSWGGVSAMSAYDDAPDKAGTIVPFAPFAPTPKGNRIPVPRPMTPGGRSWPCCRRPRTWRTKTANAPWTLLTNFRFNFGASEERVREAEAEAAHFRDRAARAEAWLVRIHNEVEQMFFPKRERDPHNTSRQ